MAFDAGFTGNAAVGFSEDQICTSRTAWSFGARLYRDLVRRRVRTPLEADTWWYRVPRHRLTLNYLDGQLVSAQDAVAGVRASTIVLRAGLSIPLGRASD